MHFAKNFATYLLFPAETTGLVPQDKVNQTRCRLEETASMQAICNAISPE